MYCRHCGNELTENPKKFIDKKDLDKNFVYMRSYKCPCSKIFTFPEDRMHPYMASKELPTKEEYKEQKKKKPHKDQQTLI